MLVRIPPVFASATDLVDYLRVTINFYDTAIAYQAGTSEEILGKAIREYAKRAEVAIATKFLPRSQEQIIQRWHMSLDYQFRGEGILRK